MRRRRWIVAWQRAAIGKMGLQVLGDARGGGGAGNSDGGMGVGADGDVPVARAPTQSGLGEHVGRSW